MSTLRDPPVVVPQHGLVFHEDVAVRDGLLVVGLGLGGESFDGSDQVGEVFLGGQGGYGFPDVCHLALELYDGQAYPAGLALELVAGRVEILLGREGVKVLSRRGSENAILKRRLKPAKPQDV